MHNENNIFIPVPLRLCASVPLRLFPHWCLSALVPQCLKTEALHDHPHHH